MLPPTLTLGQIFAGVLGFELPTIKIAGIASRDYITCTLKNEFFLGNGTNPTELIAQNYAYHPERVKTGAIISEYYIFSIMAVFPVIITRFGACIVF